MLRSASQTHTERTFTVPVAGKLACDVVMPALWDGHTCYKCMYWCSAQAYSFNASCHHALLLRHAIFAEVRICPGFIYEEGRDGKMLERPHMVRK